MSWCLLVHIAMEEKRSGSGSELKKHILIMKWLKEAQRKKLFPKSVAKTILWLINQGETYGASAKLFNKVTFLHQSGQSDLGDKSDRYRFLLFIETLKSMGWNDVLLPLSEIINIVSKPSTVSAVYTPFETLNIAFSDSDDQLITDMDLYFTGDDSGLPDLLSKCMLNFKIARDKAGVSKVTLRCSNNVEMNLDD
ncbi:DUF2913 family protein [Buttiauxella sp. JUb87]|nr:DUF2913 family protein [Buttiauxella sp. JUb87]